jgi:transcriptional regulator with XRE-family HTH domain
LKLNIELIERLRKEKKLTFEEIGKTLGFDEKSRRQKAKYAMVSMKHLPDIARILNVPEHSLTLEGKK